MTPNPNENQAEKHSVEPWEHGQFYYPESGAIGDCEITQVGEMGILAKVYLPTKGNLGYYEGQANAARIVACVNFCAGSDLNTELEFGPKTYAEGKALLRDEIKSLTAELSTLRKELEAAKKAREWLMENGKYILERSGFLNERHENELRELLNNGKDGK